MAGDFNAIKKESERKGLNHAVNSIEMVEFNYFILDMDPVDVSICGGKFTWHKSNGKSMTRLDKYLISEELLETWKISCEFIGSRAVFDYNPI